MRHRRRRYHSIFGWNFSPCIYSSIVIQLSVVGSARRSRQRFPAPPGWFRGCMNPPASSGSTLEVLPVWRAWKTSKRRRPGGMLIRCPNHLNCLFSMQRSSGSTLSSLWLSKHPMTTVEPRHPAKETNFASRLYAIILSGQLHTLVWDWAVQGVNLADRNWYKGLSWQLESFWCAKK